MDRLLAGILKSDKPDGLKETIVGRIAAASHDPAQPAEIVASILRCSLDFIVDGENESSVKLSQSVYVDWASNHQRQFVDFFSDDVVSDLLVNRHRCSPMVLWVIHFSLDIVRTNESVSYIRLCKDIGRRASCFVRDNTTDFQLVKGFCSLLLEHRNCVPTDTNVSQTFAAVLLRTVSGFIVPSDPTAVSDYVSNLPNMFGQVLREMWILDVNVVVNSLLTIFDIVTQPSGTESMSSLGAVVQFIPDVVMTTTLQVKASDPTLSDETAFLALSRMLDMLCWPSTKHIDMWIVTFMRGLASAHRYSVLTCIAGCKVEQIFEQLKCPLVQNGFYNVISYMLLSIQHTPAVFHKVIPFVPGLVASLRAQGTKEALYMLDSFVELIDTLMFQHPGFPDIYEPVVDALKDFSHPDCCAMRDKLKQYAWTSTAGNVSVFTSGMLDNEDEPRSDTGLTGLCNLGNTCYINSVIQALYMCDSFRRDILSSVPLSSQKSQMILQQVFGFLTGTQRSAYSPEKLVDESRPSWFLPGVQQDCSEFLRHLLNTIHEQEMHGRKRQTSPASGGDESGVDSLPGLFSHSSNAPDCARVPPSLVQNSFGGLLSTTCRCLQCGTESSRVESFMDLALAIPADTQPSRAQAASSSSSHSTPAMVGGSPTVSGSDTTPSRSSSMSSGASLSLDTLLQSFLTPERLEQDNQYHCDGPCNSLQDGERQVEISCAPHYLIVTLMRFAYDVQTGGHSKIFTDIQYPLALSVPVRAAESMSVQEAYGLVGVIVHSGSSSDAGHYFCYARHALRKASSATSVGDGCEEDFFCERWFMFNDSRVTRASFENIRNITHKFSRDTAYILIYRHVAGDEAWSDEHANDGFSLDPALHRYICDLLDEDNQLYLQEKERRQRSRRSTQPESRLNSITSRWKRDEDDDDLPPGGSNSGFSSFRNGPPVIF